RTSFFKPRLPTPNPEGFRARLQYHPRRDAFSQQCLELTRPVSSFFDDLAALITNAYLAVAAPEVDSDMLHARSPLAPNYARWSPATSSLLIRASRSDRCAMMRCTRCSSWVSKSNPDLCDAVRGRERTGVGPDGPHNPRDLVRHRDGG